MMVSCNVLLPYVLEMSVSELSISLEHTTFSSSYSDFLSTLQVPESYLMISARLIGGFVTILLKTQRLCHGGTMVIKFPQWLIVQFW
jgi:hypothetical protein